MARLVLGILVLFCVGCGSSDSAAVSGVVTLNGKPYSQAVVSFQPLAKPGNPYPGRGSSAYTDDNGRFVLIGDDGEEGAIIGLHRVRIMTRGNDVVGDSPVGGSPDGAPAERLVDPIPAEWNSLSDKEFEVPAGGTDQANFDIVSKKKR